MVTVSLALRSLKLASSTGLCCGVSLATRVCRFDGKHSKVVDEAEPAAKRAKATNATTKVFDIPYQDLSVLDNKTHKDKIVNVFGVVLEDWFVVGTIFRHVCCFRTLVQRSATLILYKTVLMTMTARIVLVLLGRRPDGLTKGGRVSIIGLLCSDPHCLCWLSSVGSWL
jgi:hypothetical protein